MPPIGPITNIFCCGSETGSPVGGIAPYVVSLNGLSGILTLDGQGVLDITQVGGVIYFSVSAGAGLGSVTSIGISSNSAALVVGSSPVTTAGTITLALDASLTGIAALGWVADTFAYGTGVDTFALTALTSYARTLLDDANAATARATLGGTTVGQALFTLTNPSQVGFIRTDVANTVTARTAAQTRTDLSLVIGTNVQAWSADLDSFVTNASWSGSDLLLTAGLIATTDVTAIRLVANAPAATSATLLELFQDTTDVLKVLDTGETVLTAITGFTGDILTIELTGVGNLFRINEAGDVTILGSVVAASFGGDGGSLTGLNATALTGGTVANARLDADLAAIGNNSSDGLYVHTGAGTIAMRTVTGSSFITVSNGSGVAGNPTISITSVTGSGDIVASISPTMLAPAITAPIFDKTITGSGSTGNQTINKSTGTVRFAAAATSLLVTNSLCTANSIVTGTIASNDATAAGLRIVVAAGTFTIYLTTAPTAETIVAWRLSN